MGGSGGNQLVTMAFADHAIDFWTSVATTFKDDPMVIFDLFNEPILNSGDRMGNATIAPDSTAWACWKNGCIRRPGTGRGHAADAERGARHRRPAGRRRGRHRVAHNLDMWLQYKPDDPTGNLMAAFHVYQQGLSDCYTEACWNGSLAAVAQSVPVLTGEMGEQDCAHGLSTST